MTLNIDPSLSYLNDCGCCEGLSVLTPAVIINRDGLTAIAYRAGTHEKFKKSMLARLSSSKFSALHKLTTRNDDDFTVALLDAWATVADVLTFYQERIANESYLRTATERLSIVQLARLTGYELSPGVAASTYLIFTMAEAEGSPLRTTIDKGTKVQSIPGPGEQAQIFETVEKIEARVEWNEIKPKKTEFKLPFFGIEVIYLKGTSMNLKIGDALLFVGEECEKYPKNWDFRRVKKIVTDAKNDYTAVTLDRGLGVAPAKNTKIYILRQRAALFGHNAPDWRAMPETVKKGYAPNIDVTTISEWPGFRIFDIEKKDDVIHLDEVHPQIQPDSWLVLSIADFQELYQVESAAEDSRSNFTLTAKTMRLTLKGENLRLFDNHLRDTVVFAQSEQLELAEQPLRTPVMGSPSEKLKLADETLAPVEGNKIIFERSVSGLENGHMLILSGKRLRAKITKEMILESADGLLKMQLHSDDVLVVVESPEVTPGSVKWHLMSFDGFNGFIITSLNEIILEPAYKDDELVSETVEVEVASGDPTVVKLKKALKNSYDRTTVSIYANAARATHGETVKEILGSGSADHTYQRFTLSQPLTYVSSPKPGGAESTLEVHVNDILWQEVPTMYGHGPDERIYIARTGDDGKTTIQFGDGHTGVRLPAGQENVHAMYRKGIGLAGLIKANQLKLLMTRPLGVKDVNNPIDSTGGADREYLEDARRNAPLKVLTLDRVVSLRDYEDFARAYTGIAKALATWTWDGEKRGVFITVAGAEGALVVPGSDLYNNLLTALKNAGDPLVPLHVESYIPALFSLEASINIDPDYVSEKVMDAVKRSLQTKFTFEARSFGQSVALSDVMAVMAAVPGVISVNVYKLYRADGKGGDGLKQPLPAAVPKAGANTEMLAAELLTLDSHALNLKVNQ